MQSRRTFRRAIIDDGRTRLLNQRYGLAAVAFLHRRDKGFAVGPGELRERRRGCQRQRENYNPDSPNHQPLTPFALDRLPLAAHGYTFDEQAKTLLGKALAGPRPRRVGSLVRRLWPMLHP